MKLGIVGTGMICCELIEQVLPHIPSIQIAALCSTSRSLEKAQRLGRQHSIPLITADYHTLLSADIDAVYLGIPNQLHAPYAKQALLAGKHVICEKPLASNIEEAEILAALAQERRLFLLEAISNQYMQVYQDIRKQLPRLGQIKHVFCNFSQYSSRYDRFLRGDIAPAFDPSCSGGALMDLNIYNIYFIIGLFAAPEAVQYIPIVEHAIDTSGVLSMRYRDFSAVCIGAKSCSGPSTCLIEGTKGYLQMDAPANSCGSFSLHLRGSSVECIDVPTPPHRMIEEFLAFERIIRENDWHACEAALKNSLIVSRILTQARRDAGILFPADQLYI